MIRRIKSENEEFAEMPFAQTLEPVRINYSDTSSVVPGPVEKYSLNKNDVASAIYLEPPRRLSKKEKRASIRVIKSPLRWPLLFLFVNCVVLISSLALCFSPTSSLIAEAYGISLF